jgi:hypothetical protein
MKTLNEIPNYRMVKVAYVSATNTLGSRVKIFETKRYNDAKTSTKMFGYDYEIGDIQEQACQILQRNGFNVVSRATELNNYVLMCDNWGENFNMNLCSLK